ncbi:MlaD family protein [Pseudodesulfovibrio sediminis]|uniref:Glycerophosphoryl diester phosphodiesterase n=1 Tax=Pseudodesulfovibrio sediminis TaxID=2810563 RepID=A0ABN6EZ28_9BACT|nr:MlaD family protein [Pseudodesulfovibrio sediminis]BCS90281.1 glycerophosphoryl diester phosphodiesterase [Pseudodesulfovibrio sediminis]
MIRKNDYFKLGVFIIVGASMLIAVIIILGAGRYFETTYGLETYFDESINGLAVGSPVKLRGVNIGRVSVINFVSNEYEEAQGGEARYVYVKCDINPDLFDDIPEKEFRKNLHSQVTRGLRVRPTSLGLTGQLFLNIVYEDPASSKPLSITWKPEYTYVPSTASTMSRVEGAIAKISKTIGSLKQEDIESIIADVKSIVGTLNDIMQTEGGQRAGDRMLDILDETHSVLKRMDTLLADPATARIIPETAGAITSINRITTDSADDLIAAAAEARKALESFRQASAVLSKTLSDPRMDAAMNEIAPTLENISEASGNMTAAVAKIHNLVNRLNGLAASEEANIRSILEDTRQVMQNVKELSGDAKRYPSGMLFGAPPKPPKAEEK